MAQLAIRGHATRGKEVIEILETTGGKNITNLDGKYDNMIYIINSSYYGEIIYMTYRTDGYVVFTLEEFLEKFHYKVGDKVYNIIHNENQTITKLAWDFQENEVVYKTNNNEYVYVNYLQPYKEEIMDRKYNVEEYLKVWKETEKGLEVVVNDRFELKEDNGKFYIIKKQPKYPKTYEECCDILSLGEDSRLYTKGYKASIIQNFQKLITCRDAYWMIAGGWKFDFDKPGYHLFNEYGSVQKFEGTIDCSTILSFPTKEMRDAFYENFKELIEECKEFL